MIEIFHSLTGQRDNRFDPGLSGCLRTQLLVHISGWTEKCHSTKVIGATLAKDKTHLQKAIGVHNACSAVRQFVNKLFILLSADSVLQVASNQRVPSIPTDS